jgi:transposase
MLQDVWTAESGWILRRFPIGAIYSRHALTTKSTDFHRQILGISALWKIVNVELDMEAKRVVITAEVDRANQWAHPGTKQAASLHKWTERTWRHLDTCQFETVIHANVSSVKQRDGSIEEVAVPWADRY